MKEVVHCDVLQSDPLGPNFSGFFDCVFSSFCLETASRDYDSYIRSVSNVSSLLRSGGHLILRGVLDEECYPVGGKTFHTLPLQLPQVTAALTRAGFKIVELVTQDVGETNDILASKGFCVLARS